MPEAVHFNRLQFVSGHKSTENPLVQHLPNSNFE
jgi:hypothetical protein